MKLEEIRHQIDGLDEQIACLIGRRFKLAHQIGQLKKEMGIGIEDPQREGQIITRLSAMAAREEIPTEELAAVFRHIISASKNLQGLTVGFQGEFGAFSEIAARTHFGPNVATYPFPSLAEVFMPPGKAMSRAVLYGGKFAEGHSCYYIFMDSPFTVSGEVEYPTHCLIANRS
jgi:chorismate mutase